MSFRSYALIIGLVTAAYLWSAFGKPKVDSPSLSESSTSAIRKSKKQASNQKPADEILAKDDGEENPESKEQACWNKINAGIHESDDFKWRLSAQLDNIIEPWFYRKADTPERPIQTAPNLFLLGLAKAGLLDGQKVETNIGQALDYLLEASKLDPDNSAPLLFATIVAQRAGFNTLSDTYFSMALKRGEKFDSYITQVARGVLKSATNSSEYLAAVSLTSSISVPSYGELKPLLKLSDSKKFAIQMLNDGLKQDKPRDFVNYVAIEYGVGRAALGTDAPYPTLKELWQRHPASAESDEITKALTESCDISSLDPIVRRLSQEL